MVKSFLSPETMASAVIFISARQHICLARYMLSPVRPSVWPSVRRVYHRKTAEVRIMKFSPYYSPIPLVFVG